MPFTTPKLSVSIKCNSATNGYLSVQVRLRGSTTRYGLAFDAAGPPPEPDPGKSFVPVKPFVPRTRDEIELIDVDLKWTVRQLCLRVERNLGIPVHSLSFNRREILDTDRLRDLGLFPGASIMVNSQRITPSRPSESTVNIAGNWSTESTPICIYKATLIPDDDAESAI
jgi:hypothetical protein